MSGTLALSSLIASLDRAALSQLARARRIAAPNSVNDPLDLATELLKSDSITQALTMLPRAELLLLATPAATADPSDTGYVRLRTLGLIGADNAPLAEVGHALETLLTARGLSAASLAAASNPTTVPAEPGDTSSWFASALTATGQAGWLLRDLERTPAKLNRNGEVAAAWMRTAEDRLAIPHTDELLEVLRTADLTRPEGGFCVARGSAWLTSERGDRWAALAIASVALMPPEFRGGLAGATAGSAIEPLLSAFPHRYPLATEATFAAIERAAKLWERLGVTVGGHLSAAGVAALTGSAAPDLAAHLSVPETAPGIYIQPDLSVIVPGPLTARDEAALAAIALPEQLGVASTLRISEATLSDAFHRGLTGATIRELIEGLTLTGIPQPVDYLITTLSERAGSIVVVPHFGDDARTRVEFARPELRSTVLVDRRLAHLQLQEPAPRGPFDSAADRAAGGTAARDTSAGVTTGDEQVRPLLSRLRADHVLAALLDARYPARGGAGLVAPGGAADVAQGGAADVAPGGAAGTAVAAAPGAAPGAAPTEGPGERADASVATATASDSASASASAIEALIERVLESSQDGPTDVSRQVTLAIRDRTKLSVTVEIRGAVRTFSVLPVSLAAGRLRALDEAAGVERTLPLDAITSITAIAPPA